MTSDLDAITALALAFRSVATKMKGRVKTTNFRSRFAFSPEFSLDSGLGEPETDSRLDGPINGIHVRAALRHLGDGLSQA